MSLTNVFKKFSRGFSCLLIAGVLVAPVLAASSKPANAFNDTVKYSQNTLHLKLKDASDINSTQLKTILGSAGHVSGVNKLFNKQNNNQISNKLDAALGNYVVVKFSSDVDMSKLVSNLQTSGLVSTAYPQVKPAPSPTSPNFSNLETYVKAAPTGTNSTYARTFPGGMGSSVRLVDIEYSWNTSHEDLSNAVGALVPHGTPVDPFNDNNHGTAVLGEIEGSNNVLGITGAAYSTKLSLINAYSYEYGYDLVRALNSAASLTQPGDVIQIEQQAYGPSSNPYGYVPVEWVPEVYDAISTLTANGRVVVEPAGNGSQNLDDSTLYGTSFPMGKADSGAIIVGAGENCTTSTPSRSRLSFSDYGKRVNLQGPGDCVVTTGYGDLYNVGDPNSYYTQNFSGTSSATPVVSAAAASLSSAYKTLNGNSVLTPLQIRSILINNSTAQNFATGSLSGNIGPYTDLAKVLPKADLTGPTAPSGVKVSQPSTKQRSLLISWSASSDNIQVVYYNLYRNGIFYKKVTATTYTDTSVSKGKTYSYKLTAVDEAGNVSSYSATVSLTVK